MAYNPRQARAANELVQQGYTPEAALRQVGVAEEDLDSYSINAIGTPETNPNFGQITDTGFDRVDARSTEAPVRDPETGGLRIDIFGVGDETPNDDVTTQPPDADPEPVRQELPAPVTPAPGIDLDDAPGGIRGQVDGISPYGEEDEFQLEDTGGGIRGQVDGISPFGEEDEFVPDDEVQAFDPDAVSPDSDPAIPTGQLGGATADDIAPVSQSDGDGAGYGVTPDDIADVRPNTGAATDPAAGQFGATVGEARSQAAVQTQTRQVNQKDWRVRLSLAPGANYLYAAASSGDVLFPLKATDGVLFPYTPQIQVNYQTNYTKTPLTHSNYQGLFYQGSLVTSVSITAQFTAQDTAEANYLLAALHFFRSAGKMFYGQDEFAGAPPPLLYLSGFGEYQFTEHTLLLESFNYTLPNDVDYIRARSNNVNDTSLLRKRDLNQTVSPYDGLDGADSRLKQLIEISGRVLRITPGANPAQTDTKNDKALELGGNNPTYVPTKMEVYLTLVPVQTREQISKQFSLKEFGRGSLLRKGFW